MFPRVKLINWTVRAALFVVGVAPVTACAQFDLVLTLNNPSAFTPTQRAIIDEAIVEAEALWESVILGYQPGINRTTLPITINGSTTGLGNATGTGRITAGGFTINTSGFININRLLLEDFADFQGSGVNVIDELVAHEIAHVLGIGTTWVANGVYVNGSGRYTGEFGLAAYRAEFDPDAEFIPVELSGGPGSANSHWDQLFRSTGEAGMADDPFDLSPLIGITDDQGRDLSLELLTAALDPDFGEPFLADFTIQSLRDIGFVVVPEPATGLLALGLTPVVLGRHRRRHA